MADIIREMEAFDARWDSWDRALYATAEPNPFASSDFVRHWWSVFHSGRTLRLVVNSSGVNLTGVPLYEQQSAKFGFRKILRYVGDGTANYTEMTCPTVDGCLDVLGTIVCDDAVDILRFERVRESSTTFQALRTFRNGAFDVVLRQAGTTYYIEAIDDVDRHLGQLPKKLRYQIRKGITGAGHLGTLHLESASSLGDIDRWYETFVGFSVSTFRAKGAQSSFEGELQHRFFRGLLADLFVNNRLDSYALKIDDRPIAIHFGYRTDPTIHYVLTGYDSHLADLGPGHLLIYNLLKEMIALKKRRLDLHFARGSLYKRQWANRTENVFEALVVRRNLMNKLVLLLRKWYLWRQ